MRRFVPVVTLLAVAACGGKSAEKIDSTTAPAAVAASAPAANTKADADSIRAVIGRLSAAMNSGDTAAVVAVYADDAVDYTPGMAPAVGHGALVKEYSDLFKAMKGLKGSFGTPDVTIAQSGDLAISRGSYELSYMDAKGKPATDRGNVLVGWKKVNGQWKMAASMNASATPTPGM